MCVTRGDCGSFLVSESDFSQHPGFRITVGDTIGAGDAFTAAMVHEYLAGSPLYLINEVSNLVAAWVASEVGGTPWRKNGSIEDAIAAIG